MATTDQPALSVFHEIEGGTYRLTFEHHWLKGRARQSTTIEMSPASAEQLADAIYDTINQAGARP